MRREFDGSFAASVETPAPRASLLGVRIADQRHVLSLADVQTVARAGVVTPAPSHRRELVGITALRNRIVPVFDLAALVGAAPDPRADWLVLASGHPIAFAVGAVDGYLTVPQTAVAGATVTVDGVGLPLVDLRRIVENLARKEAR
jgi:chemotaxis signal transduction protein